MNKDVYLKLKKAVIICLLVLFCVDKISEFYSEDVLDKIIFYDLPESGVQLQYIDQAEYPAYGYMKSEDSGNVSTEPSSLIDINSADAEQLQQLSKIGPVLASRIIEYRENYGAFVSIDEIKEVKGIGDKIFESIKDDIVVYP